jgi:hypothetical protein
MRGALLYHHACMITAVVAVPLTISRAGKVIVLLTGWSEEHIVICIIVMTAHDCDDCL